MGFSKQALPPCPVCRDRGMEVLESRKTKESTRRRKRCTCCGYRCTTHEVSDAWFKAALKNEKLAVYLGEFFEVSTKKGGIPCGACQHGVGGKCGLGLPEFGTEDAVGCTYVVRT